MNSPYRYRFRVTQTHHSRHRGLDLVGVESKRIYSTVDGVVVRSGWENPLNKRQGFGKRVWIQESGRNRFFVFGHLSVISVSVGQRVTRNQLIGVEGNTGHSTGSHLHYEARSGGVNGTSLDIASISSIPNRIGTFGRAPAPTPPLPDLGGQFDVMAVRGKQFRAAQNLTARTQPSTSSAAVHTVARDVILRPQRRARRGQLVGTNRNWWWTGRGWVAGAHLSNNAEQFRTTSNARLRAEPNGRILRTLSSGVVVTAISSSATIRTSGGHRWRNVSVGGQRGWIATSLLRAV